MNKINHLKRVITAILGMALVVICLSGKALGAITISIDYSLDSAGLFSDGDGAAKKAALEAARDVLKGGWWLVRQRHGRLRG